MNKFLKLLFVTVLSFQTVAAFANEGETADKESEVSAEAKGDKGCGCPHAEVADQASSEQAT